ncbi:MAG: hypothetical protein KF696_09450 [Planctomycetes bacterium]|nr:hypothetical protein [Planctomycetota bacterium]MCW8136082.1 hypothetical protein [Planctomycetota bacterium]
MPGTLYVTNMPPDRLKHLAIHVAGGMEYGVQDIGPWSLSVGKGSLAASIFVGAFVAYCDFKVHISALPDGNTQLLLERNSPWWTGLIGVGRVKRKAVELADAYGNNILTQGFQVLHRADN